VNENIQSKKDAFKKLEYFGHASDSSIQKLMYSESENTMPMVKREKKVVDENDKPKTAQETLYEQYRLSQAERRKNRIRNEEDMNHGTSLLLPAFRSSIKMSATMHATKTTGFFGYHSYVGSDDEDDEEARKRRKQLKYQSFESKIYDWQAIFEPIITPYQTEFDFDGLNSSLMSNEQMEYFYANIGNDETIDNRESLKEDEALIGELNESNVEIFALNYVNLNEILSRILVTPIRIQNEIVNKSLVNYYLFELRLEAHFDSLRNLYFFENGEFSQLFIDFLCKKLFASDDYGESLNLAATKSALDCTFTPTYVNEALNYSVANMKNQQHTERLSIAINLAKEYNEKQRDDEKSAYTMKLLSNLNCLELKYEIEWPLNIVITELCMKKYNEIFCFMLQIKFCICSLNAVWLNLKKVDRLYKLGRSKQFTEVKIMTYEMEHFLNALQNYIHNQIVNLSWHEFQEKLDKDVKSLDNLREAHLNYLNNALLRCFFSKKTASIMNTLKMMLNIILQFRFQLINDLWQNNELTQQYEHRSYKKLIGTHSIFKDQFNFLFNVLRTKNSTIGYEIHLKTLESSLNFNYFYGGECAGAHSMSV